MRKKETKCDFSDMYLKKVTFPELRTRYSSGPRPIHIVKYPLNHLETVDNVITKPRRMKIRRCAVLQQTERTVVMYRE